MRVRTFQILLIGWIVFNLASGIAALLFHGENWFMFAEVVSVLWAVGLGFANRAIERREVREWGDEKPKRSEPERY